MGQGVNTISGRYCPDLKVHERTQVKLCSIDSYTCASMPEQGFETMICFVNNLEGVSTVYMNVNSIQSLCQSVSTYKM